MSGFPTGPSGLASTPMWIKVILRLYRLGEWIYPLSDSGVISHVRLRREACDRLVQRVDVDGFREMVIEAGAT
jgi:hypothetical protein